MTEVIDTFAAARAAAAGSGSVGLVPTMGYLHEGHISLLEAARRENDLVVMSVFVNPLQFNEAADLEAYPRNLQRDVGLASDAGVDLVFAPDDSEMYPEEPLTRVTVPALTSAMEGAHRPGHFAGVATVVAKLFAGIQPTRVYFGKKDAQQLAVVRRMVLDLSFPTEVIGCPVVRHRSGLAMSSRNGNLDSAERNTALALSRGLMAAADRVSVGERGGAALEDIAMNEMEAESGVSPEYAVLAAQATMQPIDTLDQPAVLAVAGRVGGVRLIDNIHIDLADGVANVDRGVWLDAPSVLFAEPEGGP